MTPASDNNVIKGGKGGRWQWPFEEGKGRGGVTNLQRIQHVGQGPKKRKGRERREK